MDLMGTVIVVSFFCSNIKTNLFFLLVFCSVKHTAGLDLVGPISNLFSFKNTHSILFFSRNLIGEQVVHTLQDLDIFFVGCKHRQLSHWFRIRVRYLS